MKAECFMENIIQEVKDGFEDINKLSSILNYDYSFDPPASYEEISDWEKDYNVRIPDMYKSWLMLTKYARIMGGEFELFFPEISKHYENAVLIGSIGCSKELLFSSDTGEIYSIEDEIDEYEDFLDEYEATIKELEEIISQNNSPEYKQRLKNISEYQKQLKALKY